METLLPKLIRAVIIDALENTQLNSNKKKVDNVMDRLSGKIKKRIVIKPK